MTFARVLFNDLRPFVFRPWPRTSHHVWGVSPLKVFEDCFVHYSPPSSKIGLFARPSFGTWNNGVEVRDEGKEWVVESEMPGVKKEDLDVRVLEATEESRWGGYGGKVEVVGRVRPKATIDSKDPATSTTTTGKEADSESSNSQAKAENEPDWRTTFSQTLLLPRSISKPDPASIRAKLEHGVLTMRIAKPAEVTEEASEGVKVVVE